MRDHRGDEIWMAADRRMRIPYDDLRAHISTLLERRGVASSASSTTAEILLEAEARGYPSQGVSRIKQICEFLDRRILLPDVSFETLEPCPSARIIVANRSLGHPVALTAVDTAVAIAQSNGIGCVGVRGAGHIGYLTYYAERAARTGMFCIATTVSSPAVVLPQSSKCLLGTNPVAFAFPTRKELFCADFSTAEVSRGVVIAHAEKSVSFSREVGVDSNGTPTKDAAQVLQGGIFPLGNGIKGVFLNMLFGMLAGPLIGGVPNHLVSETHWPTAQPNKGDWFLCFNIAMFCDHDRFMDQAAQFLSTFKHISPCLHIPGHFSRQRMAHVLEYGFDATDKVCQVMAMT
jgi:LDH2 family malate/lactate/ureidoglycolate dehydrogenase